MSPERHRARAGIEAEETGHYVSQYYTIETYDVHKVGLIQAMIRVTVPMFARRLLLRASWQVVVSAEYVPIRVFQGQHSEVVCV